MDNYIFNDNSGIFTSVFIDNENKDIFSKDFNDKNENKKGNFNNKFRNKSVSVFVSKYKL